MWKKSKLYLIVASVALNGAFIAMWVAHAAPPQQALDGDDTRVAEAPIWCPLHRQLNVTVEQWEEIEPRLREFQARVAELCQQTDAMRSEVIQLIAADDPDVEAIRAQQDEILETKRRIQRLVLAHLLAEKEVLMPEQQQRLFGMLRDRTRCAAGPPMSGGRRGGLGRVLQEKSGD